MSEEKPDASDLANRPDAIDAQLNKVRALLVRYGTPQGLDADTLGSAVDEAAQEYAGARVHSDIGVLVERAVRAALAVPSPTPDRE